ncbi:unnamed protein product, partial [Discosporangium mesarthrocarpum]
MMDPEEKKHQEKSWVENASSVDSIKDDIKAIERAVARLSSGYTSKSSGAVEPPFGSPFRLSTLQSNSVSGDSRASHSEEVGSVDAATDLHRQLRGWSQGSKEYNIRSFMTGGNESAEAEITSHQDTVSHREPALPVLEQGARDSSSTASPALTIRTGGGLQKAKENTKDTEHNHNPAKVDATRSASGNPRDSLGKYTENGSEGGNNPSPKWEGQQQGVHLSQVLGGGVNGLETIAVSSGRDTRGFTAGGVENAGHKDCKEGGWVEDEVGSTGVAAQDGGGSFEPLRVALASKNKDLPQLRRGVTYMASHKEGFRGLANSVGRYGGGEGNNTNNNTNTNANTNTNSSGGTGNGNGGSGKGGGDNLTQTQTHTPLYDSTAAPIASVTDTAAVSSILPSAEAAEGSRPTLTPDEAQQLRQELEQAREQLDSLRRPLAVAGGGGGQGQTSPRPTRSLTTVMTPTPTPPFSPAPVRQSPVTSGARAREVPGPGARLLGATTAPTNASNMVASTRENLRSMRGVLEDREREAGRAAEHITGLGAELRASELARAKLEVELRAARSALEEAQEEARRQAGASEASVALAERLGRSIKDQDKELRDAREWLRDAQEQLHDAQGRVGALTGELKEERAEAALLRAQLETARGEVEHQEKSRASQAGGLPRATRESAGVGEGSTMGVGALGDISPEEYASLVEALEAARAEAVRARAEAEAAREGLKLEREASLLKAKEGERVRESLAKATTDERERAEAAEGEAGALRERVRLMAAKAEHERDDLEAAAGALRDLAERGQAEASTAREEARAAAEEAETAREEWVKESKESARLSAKLETTMKEKNQAMDKLARMGEEKRCLEENLTAACSAAEETEARLCRENTTVREEVENQGSCIKQLRRELAAAQGGEEEHRRLRDREEERARGLARDLEACEFRVRAAEGGCRRAEMQARELISQAQAESEALSRLGAATAEDKDTQLAEAAAKLAEAERRALEAEGAAQAAAEAAEVAGAVARRDRARLESELASAEGEILHGQEAIREARSELREARRRAAKAEEREREPDVRLCWRCRRSKRHGMGRAGPSTATAEEEGGVEGGNWEEDREDQPWPRQGGRRQ